jgi:hypothetical protein
MFGGSISFILFRKLHATNLHYTILIKSIWTFSHLIWRNALIMEDIGSASAALGLTGNLGYNSMFVCWASEITWYHIHYHSINYAQWFNLFASLFSLKWSQISRYFLVFCSDRCLIFHVVTHVVATKIKSYVFSIRVVVLLFKSIFVPTS